MEDDQYCIAREGCCIRGLLNKSLLDVLRDGWNADREGCYLDMFRLLQISVGEGGLGKGFVDY